MKTLKIKIDNAEYRNKQGVPDYIERDEITVTEYDIERELENYYGEHKSFQVKEIGMRNKRKHASNFKTPDEELEFSFSTANGEVIIILDVVDEYGEKEEYEMEIETNFRF